MSHSNGSLEICSLLNHCFVYSKGGMISPGEMDDLLSRIEELAHGKNVNYCISMHF